MNDFIPAVEKDHDKTIKETLTADYITDNPDFFLRHPKLLDQLRFPHDEKGTVSLVEVQLTRQRQKIQVLEDEITELMGIANHNEKVFRVYADLYPEIINCTQLTEIKQLLESTFKHEFGVSALALHLNDEIFSSKAAVATLSPRQLKQIQIHRMAGSSHYFGRLSQHEILQLFGENAQLNSCALMQLGDERALGLLAIGNLDPNHYTPGMDSLLLSQLCRIIAQILPNLSAINGK